MGALTSNRKRGDDYFSNSHKLFSFHSPNSEVRIDTHISKKPKIQPSTQNQPPDRPVSWRSAASRVCQYPDTVSQIRRQIHAPCRPSKFGPFPSRQSRGEVSKGENSTEVKMGNIYTRYQQAKSDAFGTLKFWENDKDVSDVDDAEDRAKNDVSEISNVEVEIFENGKERPRECNGDVGLMELDGKIGERNLQPSCSSVVSEDLVNGNIKAHRKVLELVSSQRELDVPLHKKLHDSADKRNDKLSWLRLQIQLHEIKRATLQLFRLAKKPEEDVVKEPFVPLTNEEEGEVEQALSKGKRRKVLVTHENSNIEITGELLQCLRPGAWLNDEVINVYLELLKEREKREPKKFLKCHFFNTFFYKKLIGGRSGYDFKSVRRWTTQRRLGYSLVECDKIFVPIHKEIHWCLAVINKKDEKFQYLDSLRGADKQVMKVLIFRG